MRHYPAPAAASGPTIHTGATYDDLSRDAGVVSDGDEGRPDDGGLYIADLSAGVVGWLPAYYRGKVALMENVTGLAAMSIVDDEDTLAEVSGRGWTIIETGGGTFTKTAGSSAVLNAPAGSDNAILKFAPTVAPERGVVVMKIHVTPRTSPYLHRIYCGTADQRLWLSLGSANQLPEDWDVSFQNSGGNPYGSQALNQAAVEEWFVFEYDFRPTDHSWLDRYHRIQAIDDPSRFADNTQNIGAGAGWAEFNIYCVRSGTAATMTLAEIFVWEYL